MSLINFTEAKLSKKGSSSSTIVTIGDHDFLETKPGNALKETDVHQFINRVELAYIHEPIVRTAVDTYIALCSDVELEGDPILTLELQNKLNNLCLESNTTWIELYTATITDYIKFGNAFLAKKRTPKKSKEKGVKEASKFLYKQRGIAISGYHLVPPTLFKVKETSGLVKGWELSGGSKAIDSALFAGSKSSAPEGSYRFDFEAIAKQLTGKVMAINMDVAHLAHLRDNNTKWGTGICFSVMELCNELRKMERVLIQAIIKTAIPVGFYQIGKTTPTNTRENINAELEKVQSAMNNMGPSGVVVAPESHDFKYVGAESSALRIESYLNYYTKRIISGLGLPGHRLGLENTSSLAADYASQAFVDNIKQFRAEINSFFQNAIFNELLWEMGRNPYDNEVDRVKLKFKEPDPTTLTKVYAMFADLFTKGVIDIEEAREGVGITEPIDLSQTHNALYGKQEQETPRVTTKEEVVALLSSEGYIHINDIKNLDYRFMKKESIITSLLKDKEILSEYLIDLITE